MKWHLSNVMSIIFFLRESRRKTPAAVCLKENERLFGDNALGVVWLPLRFDWHMMSLIKLFSWSNNFKIIHIFSIYAINHILCTFQSVKNPKTVYRHLQSLLGKKHDNPQVALYQKRFPEHQLQEDSVRSTVYFKNSEWVSIYVLETTIDFTF